MLVCCICGRKHDEILAELQDMTECMDPKCGGGLIYPDGTESFGRQHKPKNKKETVNMKNVPKHVQEAVDTYIEMDAKMKSLQADLKILRGMIEPYMHDHKVQVIKGSFRGSISLQPRNSAPISARYTSYDLDGVIPLLDPRVRRDAIVRVVDKDVLELLVKTGKAPEAVYQHKIIKPSITFSINHK